MIFQFCCFHAASITEAAAECRRITNHQPVTNIHTQKKPRLRDRTDRARFSRLVRHPARKGSGSIVTTPDPARAVFREDCQVVSRPAAVSSVRKVKCCCSGRFADPRPSLVVCTEDSFVRFPIIDLPAVQQLQHQPELTRRRQAVHPADSTRVDFLQFTMFGVSSSQAKCKGRRGKTVHRRSLERLLNHPHKCNKIQEAQLMLTTGSTRLAVSRGQQTW